MCATCKVRERIKMTLVHIKLENKLAGLESLNTNTKMISYSTPFRSFKLLSSALVLLALGVTAVQADSTVNTAAQPVARQKNPESWLRAHEQISRSAQRGEVPILFIGDSITHMMLNKSGSVWRDTYQKIGCVNIGLSGDKVENILWRIQNGALGTVQPKVTVLLAGVNNMRKNTPEEIGLGVGAIVDELKESLPDTKILLLGVFPRGHKANTADRITIQEINQHIEKLNDGERVFYLDIGEEFLTEDGSLKPGAMQKDGLHPDVKGYEIWAEAIKEPIRKLSE